MEQKLEPCRKCKGEGRKQAIQGNSTVDAFEAHCCENNRIVGGSCESDIFFTADDWNESNRYIDMTIEHAVSICSLMPITGTQYCEIAIAYGFDVAQAQSRLRECLNQSTIWLVDKILLYSGSDV